MTKNTRGLTTKSTVRMSHQLNRPCLETSFSHLLSSAATGEAPGTSVILDNIAPKLQMEAHWAPRIDDQLATIANNLVREKIALRNTGNQVQTVPTTEATCGFKRFKPR